MAIPTTSRLKQAAKVFACSKTGVSILHIITGSQSSTLFDWCRDPENGIKGKREFKNLLRRRQRERHKTIGYNEKNKGPARAL